MSDNVAIVREFVETWRGLNPSELAAYFTEDGTYHNIPAEPVAGRQNIEQFIAAFTASWTETQWDIISIAGEGDLVFCERIDRTKTKAGNVDLPCLGVFEMRDGQIHVWRDYFDMNTFVSAMR